MATMSLQAAYDQARSYLEANKVEQAIGVAQHILEHFPESLEAHRILGEAYLAGRQFEQAEAAFARVLRADPEDIPAHVGLGITFERQGKLDHAVAEFEQALEVRPDMPELRSQLLRLYTDIWGSEGATLRLSRPGLARLYAKGHMLPQAIQEYRSVIEEQPERFDARVGLAEALWRNQQEQQAAEVCSEILALRPDVLKANLLLGYIKLASGDPDGEPFWRQAQRLDPYQHVARSLFETLPDLPAPNVQIPAWDEARWAERRAREEAERRAREEAERRAAQAAVATAAVAAVEPEPELAPAWGPAKASVTDQGGFDADDLLASLLAMEPPVPTERGVDLDTSSGIVPFSLEDIDGAAPQRATTPAEPELEPFSLADLGLSDEEIAQLRAEPEPLSPPPAVALPATLAEADQVEAVSAPAEPELAPFSLEDLGLSSEEIAQLEAAGEAAAPPAAPAEPELAPFSLEDLGLSSEEIAQLEAAQAAAAPPAEPELTPFSLEELGLSPEEIAQLEAAQAAAPPAEPAEPELAPFSLEDLDLSPEEIAQLEAAQAAAPGEPEPPPFSPNKQELPSRELSVPGAAAEAPAAEESDLGEITPFSLDEFDLNAPGFEAGEGELPPSLRPFSIDEPPPATAPSPPEEVEEGAYSWQQPAAKPQPGFARRQEEETPGQGSIFERLKTRAAALPPQEPEPLRPISDEELAQSDYFSHDDVSLRDEESGGQNRFAGGFRLPREDAALIAGAAALTAADRTAEQPTAPPAEPAEPELTPFSLEELGLSPEEIAQLEAAQAAAEQPPAEPELTPFSLEELGLSPEEIAQLEAAQAPAVTPAEPAEPELTPFSLEELGLSPEEIAQLEAASRGELPLPATGETIVPGWSRGEEPELTPFALDEQSPEAAASGAELDLSGLKPFSPEDFGAAAQPSAPGEALPEDVEPFSFDDLDLGDLGSFDGQMAGRELGLSAEELEGLDLGQFETILPEHRDARATTPEQGDAALERLMGLGRRQGYVDLTDIIAVVSDPEAEAERIEAIGWALHRAGIQIRDGDEIIDMEEGEAEGDIEAIAPAPEGAEAEVAPFSLEELGLSPEEIAALGLTEATAAAPVAPSAEPELTPFSLEELGLSPEEIAQFEAAQADAAPPAEPAEPELTPFSLEELGLSPEEIAQLEAARAAAEPPAAPPAEPELTPFSLEELGLSPEEIAQLEAARAAAELPAAGPATEEQADLFDFDLAEAPPVEKVTKRTAPRVEEPPPAVDPADAAFQPEPLDSLDDIWQTPLPPPPAPPATRQEPPQEAPARREPIAGPTAAPPAPVARRDTAPAPRREGGRLITRGRDEERFARREAARLREPASRRGGVPLTMRLSDLTPTGDATLDEYLRQLEGDPENSALALAIGRLCAQTGRADVMVMAYKSLIRAGHDLDLLAEELEGLIDVISDGEVQRHIFRLLGDAYARQGRSRDAIAAYGQAFAR
jgi:tetratricopeptide (TPR) repeat protein